MAKYFNPAKTASVKLEVSKAPMAKKDVSPEFLVRRVARSHRRDRRAI